MSRHADPLHADPRHADPAPLDEPRGAVFWVALVLGWALVLFGIWTVVDRAGATRPIAFATWLVGLTLVHDLLVAPAISAVAALVGPRLPHAARAWALGAAIVSGALVLVALPPLLGDAAGNATLLPRDEAAGLAVALVVVWAVAVAAIVLVRIRGHR